MAYNALYGYDTGTEGFGPANMTGASADGLVQPLVRSYPAWMQDLNARGIGNAEDTAQAVPAFLSINSGPLTSDTPAAPATAASTAPAASSGIQSGGSEAGNGGGAAEQQDVNGGYGGQNLGPSPGNLGDLFGLGPSVSDIANLTGGASNVGDITGGNSGGPSGIGAGANLDPTGGGLGSGANLGDITGGGSSLSGGNQGADNGGGQGGGGAGDTSGGGAQGGGEVGSSSEVVGHAKGGIIGRNALMGPNPPGKDDGYGALEVGEGVLTDKALKHYGKGIVARLNRLQVPKERLRA